VFIRANACPFEVFHSVMGWMASDPLHFYRESQGARKIIVVDLGFLGDTVHLIPALWEIKRQYPNAALHVLTSNVGAEVLQMASCVDRAWSVELHPQKRTFGEQWAVGRSLRREGFDLAFNLGGADRSIFLTALTGAKRRVAHQGGRNHFWNHWLIRDWVSPRDPKLPANEQKRQVLKACGLTLEAARWNLVIPEEAVARAASLLPIEAIHFSVNASTPLKEWPLEHWIALAKRLLDAEKGLHIVASGSADSREQEQLKTLKEGVACDRLIVLPAKLSIPELAAILKRSRLHVGGDSGVLHLAVAVGTPTVSLFRQYHDASAWMPSGEKHRVLSVPCKCIGQAEPACASKRSSECLATIAPEAVAEAIL
jgi:ADP-heptose:LPS heptosyltransferase